MAEDSAVQAPHDAPLEQDDEQAVEHLREARDKIMGELRKIIVGLDQVIDEMMIALFSKGHCLLVGVPGLAKTLLVSSLAQTLSLSFKRIQFTPDLMPSDITGTEILQDDPETGERMFKFYHGPVFANIILADEINRTPPKTQAALLESMQEKKVSAAGVDYELDEPFFVLATQNPSEQEGTYPLPTIQQDRFMFSIIIGYLPKEDEIAVVNATTSKRPEQLECVMHGRDLLAYQRIVRAIPVAEEVARYAVRLAGRSRPQRDDAPDFVKEYVSWGASLRASHYLVLAGKVLLHQLLIKLLRLALLNRDGTRGALPEAGPQAVTVDLADEACLAVDYLQRSLGTRGHAGTAAVTELLVNVDNLPRSPHPHPPSSSVSWRSVLATKLPPAFLAQAFTGRGTPVDAGRDILAVDAGPALVAPDTLLVGEHLHLGTAVGALVQRHPQVAHVLPGAFKSHFLTSSGWLVLVYSLIVRRRKGPHHDAHHIADTGLDPRVTLRQQPQLLGVVLFDVLCQDPEECVAKLFYLLPLCHSLECDIK